jgi:outer membrane receptor protein involved in Fe transport
MDNYEIGYRSTFGSGRGRFNLTAFLMEWSDYQLQLIDPSIDPCLLADHGQDGGDIPGVCGQPWQAIITNAGDAHIQGITFELDYAINDSWVVGMNLQQIEAETDTDADLTGNGDLDLVSGLRLPLTAETKLAAWVDFTTPSRFMGSEEAFLRFQVSYTGDSMNQLEPSDLDSPNPQLTNESYSIADIRGGWRGESWEVALFVNNITDERAVYTYQTNTMLWAASSVEDGRDHWQSKSTNRPTEYGIRYMKRWGN